MDILTLIVAVAIIVVWIMNLIPMFKKSFWWGLGGFLLGIVFIAIFWFKFKTEGSGKYVAGYYALIIPYFLLTSQL